MPGVVWRADWQGLQSESTPIITATMCMNVCELQLLDPFNYVECTPGVLCWMLCYSSLIE